MKSFCNYHPFILFGFFISVLLISMFATNPVIQIISLIGSVLFSVTITQSSKKTSGLFFYIALFLIITIFNPLFNRMGITPLFYINNQAVTLEALVYGGSIAIMLIAVILWCKNYSNVMTSDKFVYIFGRAMPKMSLVLCMAIRYIPMLKRQSKKISRTQKAMGLYSSNKFFERLKSLLRVMSVLISWSLENAVETSNSMKSRGYGLKGHTNYSIYKFSFKDAALLIVTILLLVITIAGIAAGSTAFVYYPKISKISFCLNSIITYMSFALLSFLPFFIEVGESVRWKYYRSKI